jgi:hypothetical protein
MLKHSIERPYYPIIYVRGYAGTEGEVEDTVADPYMGFNLGATQIRQAWTGQVGRHVFESPVVRLMKDFGYADVYEAGEALAPGVEIVPRSIVIHRYYDQVSKSLGAGDRLPIEDFAKGLSDLIIELRDRMCGNDAEAREAFRVYLVGHSMGGLVIRCFLQNPAVGDAAAKELVDKVFTYATPHNGIELELVGNVPAFLTANNADNFNRRRMAEYLALPEGTDPVRTLNGVFDPDRFFCLVGTNSRDYAVAAGWSSRAVGPYSDGLVRINNAIVTGPTGNPADPVKLAPRAYVHRSHSGHYGIVNSEEGYQNLTRFLFGDIRVDGVLEIEDITLPAELERLKDKSKVRASYHFEAIARVRGARWDLSRRVAAEYSTVFRTYGELFPQKAGQSGIEDRPHHNRPELFTAFLSSDARVDKRRRSLGFSLDLGVLVPDYEVDGLLWMKDHFDGGYLYREKINLEAIPPSKDNPQWGLRYGYDSRTPNRVSMKAEATPGPAPDTLEFRIPVVQKTNPGIDAALVLTAR